ncbi:PHD-finger domain-containing protein [Colletotrichum salicis]|uniref:PHD-finger domain-containing protein n=1 Tax=Colletotrichum salicis TaxID=1209931 RepID=A0A135V942_9PEZI|nr:PHD-finger domain-containing protein [Colletotrichum salicis]
MAASPAKLSCSFPWVRCSEGSGQWQLLHARAKEAPHHTLQARKKCGAAAPVHSSPIGRLSVSFTQSREPFYPRRTLSLTFSTSPRRLLSLLLYTLPTRHDMNLPCTRLSDMRTPELRVAPIHFLLLSRSHDCPHYNHNNPPDLLSAHTLVTSPYQPFPSPRHPNSTLCLLASPLRLRHPVLRHSHAAAADSSSPPPRSSELFLVLVLSPPSPYATSMAPPSPRRSSRARGNTVSQSQQSSTTSSLSSRGERTTRSLNKTSSAKSTPSASLSSEPPEDLEDALPSRRRTRAQEDARDKPRVDPYDMATGSDDVQEDDESVRCVCGFDEYPGPPPFEEDSKHGKHNPEADFFASIELSDEVSGLFVQCDVCKVWQHGACVGIFTEESSPDEYFCEKCRKDLHKIHAAANGQRYSNYLPLNRPSRATSRAASLVKDGTRSPKEGGRNGGRASSATQASKRRSTMNSRDAAYDEDEQLRRAIEASKEETVSEPTETTSRRTKRGRSDSIDYRNSASLKRQRTSSPSMSPPPEKTEAIEDDTDEENNGRNGQPKKPRGTRTQREKSDREERDRQRAEAANRRKGRADRRRAEGTTPANPGKESEAHVGAESDPSEEVSLVTARPAVKPTTEPVVPVEAPPSSAPTPDTPPANQVPVGSSHKKTSRNNQKRGKGRNQYTKDRDDNEDTPARSMSRDIGRNYDDHAGAGTSKHSHSDHPKHTRTKANSAHSKVSMNDMKRRVSAFLDFISKTQVELAGEALPGSRSSQNSSQQQSPRATAAPDALKISVNGDSAIAKNSPIGTAATDGNGLESKDFKALNCVEMMDALTRDLLRWQNQYAS